MEGPFVVDLQASATDSWQLRAVEDALKRRVIIEATIEPTTLVQSLIEASDSLLTLCRVNGWWSTDADALSAATTILRRHAKMIVSHPNHGEE
jgi:hypothetical protein